MAKISILCPSYNHERYVEDFINSIYSQTIQDWELIIVDDCSQDNNVRIIESFNDNRIKLIKHPYNKGINSALQTAFENSSADILCFIASDDTLDPRYCETVINLFQKHLTKNVIYFPLHLMDVGGNKLEKIMKLPKKDKFEILHDSFFGENQLPSPGMAMRRMALKEILPLPNCLFQCQDWDMHNKLLCKNDILLSDVALVNYRTNNSNSVSSFSYKKCQREDIEKKLLMDYFTTLPVSLIKDIFFQEDTSKLTSDNIPIFLGFQALKSNISVKQQWGYEVICKFCDSNEKYNLLFDLYGYDFKKFISQSDLPVENEFQKTLENKIKKYKKKIKKYKRLVIFSCLFGIISIITMFVISNF